MRTAKKVFLSAAFFSIVTLDGCSWFEQVGENFPVVGDRCEYWQCFTEYGQQQSDLIKRQKARAAQNAENAPPPNAKPINSPSDIPPGATGYTAPATAPTDPMAAAPASTGTTQPPQHHVQFLDPSKLEPITIPQNNSDSSDAGWFR